MFRTPHEGSHRSANSGRRRTTASWGRPFRRARSMQTDSRAPTRVEPRQVSDTCPTPKCGFWPRSESPLRCKLKQRRTLYVAVLGHVSDPQGDPRGDPEAKLMRVV